MRHMIVVVPLTKEDHGAIMDALERGEAVQLVLVSEAAATDEAADMPVEPKLPSSLTHTSP
jgi:hypothetical protein